MEELLGHYVPDIRIPYWDWANDRELPGWVYSPPGVARDPGAARRRDGSLITLPTSVDISDTLSKIVYPEFTTSLEFAHNDVHMWVGGIMQDVMDSPTDPMFWLHHANVDRIWQVSKKSHPKERPPLSGPSATMDPWPHTVTDTNWLQNYFYYYV